MLIEHTTLYVRDRAGKALAVLKAADAAYAVERMAYRAQVKQEDEDWEASLKEAEEETIQDNAKKLVEENREERGRFLGTFMTDELTMEEAVATVKSTTFFVGRYSRGLPSYLLIDITYPNTTGIRIINELIRAVDRLPDDQNVMLTEQEIGLLQLGDTDE